jgi:hypothetical protein
MRKLRVALAVMIASAGGLAAAGEVLAQAQHPLAPSRSTRAISTAALPGKQKQAGTGCFGQTDNPHNSRHFPGDVSVSSRTVCSGEAVTVTVSLYKRANGSWHLLDTGSNPGAGRTQANAHGRCGRRGTTHRFLGIAYHTATGHTPALTRNTQTVTCR